MNLSMSVSKGNGNLKHNTRTQKKVPKNINKEKIKDNVILIDKDIKKEYEIIFGESVKKYNEKQKRNDRKIKNYYSKIVNDKKTKIFHELVIQVGNKDEQINNIEVTNKIYKEFVEDFIEKNTNLKVIGAYIHNDEETPHLHLDYIPVAKYSKGLSKRVSNDKAIVQMGYENWNEWKDKTFLELERICAINGVNRELKNNKNKHIENVELFKSIQKEKELLEIEKKDLVDKRNITAIEREKYNNELKHYKSSSLQNKKPKQAIIGIETKETLINNNYLKISKEDWHNHLNEIDKTNNLITLLEEKNKVLLEEKKELEEENNKFKNKFEISKNDLRVKEIKLENLEYKYNKLIKINNNVEYNKKIQEENNNLKIEIKQQQEYIDDMEKDNQNTYDYFEEKNNQLYKEYSKLEKENQELKQENKTLKNRLDKYIEFFKATKNLIVNLFKNKSINLKELDKEVIKTENNELIDIKKEVYISDKERIEEKIKKIKEQLDYRQEELLGFEEENDVFNLYYDGEFVCKLGVDDDEYDIADKINELDYEKNRLIDDGLCL